MDQRAVELTITGKVQDVGFRNWLAREANRLGVVGWVRNNTDGTVSAVAEGARETVDSFLDIVRRGPEYGQVEEVRESDTEAHGYSGFSVEY